MDIREKAIGFLNGLDMTDDRIISRIQNAESIEILSMDENGACKGEAIGSCGEVYRSTLGTCSCIDWTHRKDKEIPCKHQIALAMAFIKKTGNDAENAQFFNSFNEKIDICKIDKKKTITTKSNTEHGIDKIWNKNSNNLFSNKTFLFTGSLEHMKREEAQKRVEALGGKAASGVTKTLSVLVATSQTSTKWKKAQELNEKGASIELWTEEQFLVALKNAEQNNAVQNNAVQNIEE